MNFSAKKISIAALLSALAIFAASYGLAQTAPAPETAPAVVTAVGDIEQRTPPPGAEENRNEHDGAGAIAEPHAEAGHTSKAPPIWMIIPFVILLLMIAIMPLAAEHWWHQNKNKAIASVVLGLPMGVFYLINDVNKLAHTMAEYVSFIILLFSLFTISGGIQLKGDIKATPRNNLIFLLIGSLIASFIGTTGAAMLLIRPLLQTNIEREYKTHTVIFFIFTVCNIGGCLTPLGDPPLFLGYLKGVPFTWTFGLWKEWLLMCTVVLTIYYIVDRVLYSKETIEHLVDDATHIEPLRLSGNINFLLVSGVIFAAAFLHEPYREIMMLVMAFASLALTKKEIRAANDFNFYAIVEVAVLFFGIFLTMIPALLLLEIRGGELGITQAWQFFWATGILSSFLDNAPTYLTFLSLGSGLVASTGAEVPMELAKVGITTPLLVAISLGAVFMGANTYIGNAPNFMVKVIAEQGKVKMPSFFGYMLWSFGILTPLNIIITFIFLL